MAIKKIKKLTWPKFTAHKKNLDIMRLLVSHTDFQKDVKDAREYLHIPLGGFSSDEPRVKEWYDELLDRSEEMMNSRAFNTLLKDIYEKRKNGELGPRMINKQNRLIHFKVPVNYLTYTSQFLTEKYNIPANFKDNIKQYIIFNIVSAPGNNFGGGEYPEFTLPSEARYVPMKIYTCLTDDELQDLKREIELNADCLPSVTPLKNIEKKLTIEEWFNNRKKFDPVEMKEYKMSAEEIAENVLGAKGHKKDVYEAVREVRKLRQKKFGK